MPFLRQQPQWCERARSQCPIPHTETHPTPTHTQGCGASTPAVADGATDCVVKPVDSAAVTAGKPVPAAPAPKAAAEPAPEPESVERSPEQLRTMSVKSSTPVLPPSAVTEEDDHDSWGPAASGVDRLSDIDA